VDVVVSGSRCRGLEKAGSDLDVVVEYKGREHEDDLFNAFNEDGLMIGGVKVDINPITEGKTGTLATYLPGVESYLAEKQAMQKASALEAISEKTVTLTVAECGEFHSLGEFHENIASVEEAIAVWKSIPPERMNGIPSIGINIHTEGTEHYEDVEMDIFSGKVIDLEVLDYVPDITDDPKAIEVIAELIDKLPDIEVCGSLEKWQAAILASQIDQLSYDYDTYQYQDTVEDREAQVANITEDIRNGNTGYLNDFLNAVISEGVREGITDIFGEGVEIGWQRSGSDCKKGKGAA
jgi:putative nucleotidyltransferase domain protein (fragment)